MLKTCGDKSRDGKNNRCDLIQRSARAVSQPNRKADQGIAQDSQRSRLNKFKVAFISSNPQGSNADKIRTKRVLLAKKHQNGRRH